MDARKTKSYRKVIGAASRKVWDSYTPEQRAARVAACQAGRDRSKAKKAQTEVKVTKPKLKPQPQPQVDPARERDIAAALTMLGDMQRKMAMVLGFEPTLSQTMTYLLRCEHDGRAK